MNRTVILVATLSLLLSTGCEEPERPIEPPEVEAPAAPDQRSVTEELTVEQMQNTVVDLHTSLGTISIRFFPEKAPNHVRNFIELAESGFYDRTRFHRVIPNFMIQGGDPNTISGFPATWGLGGTGENLAAEFNDIPHERGIVSMARSGHPDSASSQFFIMVASAPDLDGQYTAFGEVTAGMDVVDRIVSAPRGEQDRPHNPVPIESATVRTVGQEQAEAQP